jgi:Uma2 family endonuclease
LSALLTLFAEFFKRGRVLVAPVEMKVSPTSNAREPDILFVARENLGIIDDKRLNGPADLIIEIVSPESIYRDRDRKFQEYQSAGVKEYWMVDPRPGIERAQFWVLNATGDYEPVHSDEDDIYHSTVLAGFWLDTGWLWQEELPEPLSAFAQIAGFPPEMIAMLRQLATRGPLSGKE